MQVANPRVEGMAAIIFGEACARRLEAVTIPEALNGEARQSFRINNRSQRQPTRFTVNNQTQYEGGSWRQVDGQYGAAALGDELALSHQL